MRENEAEQVVGLFRGHHNIPLVHVNAAARFIGALAGHIDPEQKRKIIGEAARGSWRRERCIPT